MLCYCAGMGSLALQPASPERSPAGRPPQLLPAPGVADRLAAGAPDELDRPPLFARMAVPSPVKAEPDGNEQRKPPADSGADAAVNSGPAADSPVKRDSSARDAVAASATVARQPQAPTTATERQQGEPAPRKGQAKAGGKRKHGDASRNGTSAGLVPKAARPDAQPLNGKVNAS